MEGLDRLEYRGYDSAGVALVDGDRRSARRAKKAGKLANLRAELDRDAAAARRRPRIGHTRWATHGGPTDENAHPHRGGRDGKLALIHNGIIENFHALKTGLLEPTAWSSPSETDTEVVAHLLGPRLRADRATSPRRCARVVAAPRRAPSPSSRSTPTSPGVVVGARRNSPLVVGLGEGENFLGSDVAAFIGHTRAGHGARPGPDRHHHAR